MFMSLVVCSLFSFRLTVHFKSICCGMDTINTNCSYPSKSTRNINCSRIRKTCSYSSCCTKTCSSSSSTCSSSTCSSASSACSSNSKCMGKEIIFCYSCSAYCSPKSVYFTSASTNSAIWRTP